MCSPGRMQQIENWLSKECPTLAQCLMQIFECTDPTKYCRVECGNRLYNALWECEPPRAKSIDVFCSFNEKGKTCYNSFATLSQQDEGSGLLSACTVLIYGLNIKNCSILCQNQLQYAVQVSRCCLYSTLIGNIPQDLIDNLYNISRDFAVKCDGAFSAVVSNITLPPFVNETVERNVTISETQSLSPLGSRVIAAISVLAIIVSFSVIGNCCGLFNESKKKI